MLTQAIDWLVYSFFSLDSTTKLAQAIHFLLYDFIKIILLVAAMISVVGFLRTYISQQKMRQWLEGKGILGNILASLFGTLTPFCSCSSIPLFLGFVKAGIPLGIMFSFLITSPLINEYLVVLMLGFFGLRITILYIISGVTIGVVSGLILGKLRLERYLMDDLVLDQNRPCSCSLYKNLRQRVEFGINEAASILRKLWIWILAGVAIGAAIHNYIPQESIQSIISAAGVFAVPIAVLLGVPIYGNCAAIVPVALVLFQKGIPLGTALAFMMAAAALSLPEAAILKRAMKWQLVATFFAITSFGIIIIGYLLNLLQ